jgi:WD40 repeat protein
LANARRAEEERRKADASALEAKKQSDAVSRLMEQLYVSNGLRFEERGDPLGALQWYARSFAGDSPFTKSQQQVFAQRVATQLQFTKMLPIALFPHPGRVTQLAFDKAGGHLLVGLEPAFKVAVMGERPNQGSTKEGLPQDPSSLNTLSAACVWDLSTSKVLREQGRFFDGTDFLASWTSPQGNYAAIASRRSLQVFQFPQKEPLHRAFDLTGLPQGPTSLEPAVLSFSVDDQLVAFGQGAAVTLMELPSGKVRHRFQMPSGTVQHLLFSPGTSLLAAANEAGRVQFWKTATGEAAVSMDHGTALVHLAFRDCDGLGLVTVGLDGAAKVWHTHYGHLLTTLRHLRGSITWAEFSPDGRRIVTAGTDQTAYLWQTKDGAFLRPLVGHQKALTSASFSPDGSRLVTASEDGSVRVWDSNGKELEVFLHPGPVGRALFHPDGRRVASVYENTVRLWDLAADPRFRTTLPDGSLQDAIYSPDGTWLLVLGTNGTVRLVEATTGKEVAQVSAQAEEIQVAAFRPDGKQFVTGGVDGNVRVWTITNQKGRPECVTQQRWKLKRAVMDVSFSAQGQWIITACADGTAGIWESTTGKLLQEMDHHDIANVPRDWIPLLEKGHPALLQRAKDPRDYARYSTYRAQLSPDQRFVITVSDHSGQVFFWKVNVAEKASQGTRHRRYMPKRESPKDSGEFSFVYAQEVSPQVPPVEPSNPSQARPNLHGTTGIPADLRQMMSQQRAAAAGSGIPKPSLRSVPYFLLSPDGKRLLVSKKEGAYLYDLATLTKPEKLPLEAPGRMAWSHDSQHLAYADPTDVVRLWHVNSRSHVGAVMPHRTTVWQVYFAPQGQMLLTLTADGLLHFWDAQTGTPFGRSVFLGEATRRLCFDAQGKGFLPLEKENILVTQFRELAEKEIDRRGDVRGERAAAASSAAGSVAVGGAQAQVLATGDPAPPRPQQPLPEMQFFDRRTYWWQEPTAPRLWRLPVHWDLEACLALSPALCGQALKPGKDYEPVSWQEQARQFTLLCQKHGELFQVSPTTIHAWRLRELAACEQEKNTWAWDYHRQWLEREQAVLKEKSQAR